MRIGRGGRGLAHSCPTLCCPGWFGRKFLVDNDSWTLRSGELCWPSITKVSPWAFPAEKSIKAGSFRLNFSKSGIGLSAEVPGFRVTQSSTGRRCTTFNLPGSGMSYRTAETNIGAQSCLVTLVALLGLAAGGIWLATSA